MWWCHSLVLVLEPSLSPTWAGIFGRAALVLFFAMDDLPEATAAWEPQSWCSKRIITRTGFCMAKAVPVDCRRTVGCARHSCPSVDPAWVGRPQPGFQGHIPILERWWSHHGWVFLQEFCLVLI